MFVHVILVVFLVYLHCSSPSVLLTQRRNNLIVVEAEAVAARLDANQFRKIV